MYNKMHKQLMSLLLLHVVIGTKMLLKMAIDLGNNSLYFDLQL